MPWCITCAELGNPDWDKGQKPHILHHKHISWREYLQHLFMKKYKGHETYIA